MRLDLPPRQIVFRDDDLGRAALRARKLADLERIRRASVQVDARKIFGEFLRNGGRYRRTPAVISASCSSLTGTIPKRSPLRANAGAREGQKASRLPIGRPTSMGAGNAWDERERPHARVVALFAAGLHSRASVRNEKGPGRIAGAFRG